MDKNFLYVIRLRFWKSTRKFLFVPYSIIPLIPRINRRNRQFRASCTSDYASWHDAIRSKFMINRNSDRRTHARTHARTYVRSPVFLFSARLWLLHAADGRSARTSPTAHAYTHVRMLAAEYNSGNTMELGQFCFDARLRSFHLAAPFRTATVYF